MILRIESPLHRHSTTPTLKVSGHCGNKIIDSVRFSSEAASSKRRKNTSDFFGTIRYYWNRLTKGLGSIVTQLLTRIASFFGYSSKNASPKPVRPIPIEAKITATHELGHALLCRALGISMHEINVKGHQESRSRGYVVHTSVVDAPKSKPNTQDYLREILVMAAGYASAKTKLFTQLNKEPKKNENALLQIQLGPIGDINAMRADLKKARENGYFLDTPGLASCELGPAADESEVTSWTSREAQNILNTWKYPIISHAYQLAADVIAAVPVEKFNAMVKDLFAKGNIKGKEKINAFFEHHLGRNFRWTSVQNKIDHYLKGPQHWFAPKATAA